jgi:hypothetical protein
LGHGSVSEIQNPVTRHMVRVDPPYEIASPDEFGRFIQDFEDYCRVCWVFERREPEVINPLVLWFADPDKLLEAG